MVLGSLSLAYVQKCTDYQYLPWVEDSIGDGEVRQCCQHVIVTVLGQEVHGQAMDGRKSEAVKASEVEEPVATEDTVTNILNAIINFYLSSTQFPMGPGQTNGLMFLLD